MNEEQKRKRRREKRIKKRVAEKLEKEKAWKKFFNSSKRRFAELKKEINSGKSFFCIDTEEHEFNKKLLEVGISIYDGSEIKTYHFVLKENYNLKNKKHVPDHKDNFNFGDSYIITFPEIKKAVIELSEDCDFLVGHSVHNDIFFLEKIKAKKFKKTFDTQIFQKLLYHSKDEISLSNLCKQFDIPTKFLHNAGNDAHYTMECLIKLSEE